MIFKSFLKYSNRFLLTLAAIFLITNHSQSTNLTAQEFNTNEFGVEIKYPDNRRAFLLRVPSARLYAREPALTINNPQLAGDFTAIEIETKVEKEAVTIRLSILYNDLKTYQWGKDKKEKLVKLYTLRAGETIRTMELIEFGIDPIELKVLNGNPELLQPNVDVQVINKTKSLDVVKIERQLDLYIITLKNLSDKPINSYSVSYGQGGGISMDGTRNIGRSGFEPGATQIIRFSSSEKTENAMSITFLMFDDGTFEGDEQTGLIYLARREGAKLQAPKALQMIEPAIKANNDELETVLEKLEADFWAMPEALSKDSAIEHLKNRFPALDVQTISALYEEMKGEFYTTRNIALTMFGEMKRMVQQMNEAPKTASNEDAKLSYMRTTLRRAKERYEQLISSLK